MASKRAEDNDSPAPINVDGIGQKQGNEVDTG